MLKEEDEMLKEAESFIHKIMIRSEGILGR